MLSRLFYLGYYALHSDWRAGGRFVAFARRESGRSSVGLLADMIGASLRHNISPLEYFQFRFFELPEAGRKLYAGAGFMYEYQRLMNPKPGRTWLEDKIAFHARYGSLVRRAVAPLEALRADEQAGVRLLGNASGRVVIKGSRGQCGREIAIIDARGLTAAGLVKEMERQGYDLAEEFVVQHRELMVLSPAGLNTVRVITQLDPEGRVELLAARLRISVNSVVDNMAAGNCAALVDLESGEVTGPGVYSDVTKKDEVRHPVTDVPIVGFRIPHWRAVIALASAAALLEPSNRSVGWDIAVTDSGVDLIEGNHNWCKLLWQLPARRGLKPSLESYLRRERARGGLPGLV